MVQLATNKTVTLPLDWEPSSSTLSVLLPDTSFPLLVAFGVGIKIPEVKGGFDFSFPSFKFGKGGEVEESDTTSEDEESTKKSGISFGFKGKGKAEGPKVGVLLPYNILMFILVRFTIVFLEIPIIQT